MSDKKTESKQHVKEIQLVIFRLADEEFGLEISQVKEIIRLQDITPMPKAPKFIEGVINLRGQIIAVMDLAKRLAVPQVERTEKTRIVIAEMEGETIGLIVDEVPEVLRMNEDMIDPAPEMFESQVHSEFIRGLGKYKERLIILLDVNKILNIDEIKQVSQTAEA